MGAGTVRRVLALRHAKAEDRTEEGTDAQRVLTGRGRKDARALGRLLGARGLVPDHVVCSPAARAVETARLVLASLPECPEPVVVEGLYAGDAAVYLEALERSPVGARCVLIVGHNPATEEMASRVCGAGVALKTCHLAVLEVPVEAWAGLPSAHGRLVEVLEP